MFEQSLVISSRHSIAPQRRWSTAAAAALEATVLSVLVLYPLLHPAAMSQLFTPRAPAPIFTVSASPPPSVRAVSQSSAVAVMTESVLRQPTSIPPRVAQGNDVAPPTNPIAACGLNCTPLGVQHGMGEVPPPIAPPRPVSRIISKLDPGQIIRRLEPAYPPLAKVARVQGDVVLRAVISRAGEIENLQIVSGNSMLAKAAFEAVQQWKFRPYILNGLPVEVETQITVRFVLGQ
jgi:protein TonB